MLYLEKWRQDKDFPRQRKAGGLQEMLEKSPLSWSERTQISNMETYENIKDTGKGKYTVKFRLI